MTAKEYFTILIPSLAFSVALFTFLSNNPRFREFSRKFGKLVILQLGAILTGSLLIFIVQLETDVANVVLNVDIKFIIIAEILLKYGMIFLFVLSWGYLCYIFYTIYGSLYYMRKKRFLKYSKQFGWIYEKFFHKKNYEMSYRERTSISMDCLPGVDLSEINKGGSILLLYDSTVDCSDLIAEYIISTIKNEETIDFISTNKTPLEIVQSISNKTKDKDLFAITKKLSIIDCFSMYYSFDDKVLKFKMEELRDKGFKFYQADSFASIHTATNSSWYRFRQQCKIEESNFRVPHRTVFYTLSSLIQFSSEEQFFLYLRHVLSSEKAYGMITLLLEPLELENGIKGELIRSFDIVIEIDDKKNIKLIKSK